MTRSALVLLCTGLALASCGQQDDREPAARETSGAPSETDPPNAAFLKPAFAGQTRAPTVRADVAFEVGAFANGLDPIWSMEFLPDGRMIVAEKSGAFRLVGKDGAISERGRGLPAVDAEGQGGLLDVALDPDFASNRTIYWSYSEPRRGGNGTAIARGRLASGARPDLTEVQVIFRMMPTLASSMHFGGRLAFAPDGTLFATLGERSIREGRMQAQDLASHFGKIVRINRDGSVPSDNPFVGRSGARAEIWSYGHRNPQGLAFHPETAQLWAVEHGPRGGDELNLIQKGADYGWPTVTYGIEYGGEKIGKGIAVQEGMQQPVYYWDPVIAPSALLFYNGDMFPAWKGSAFLGGLGSMKLVRLTMKGGKVVGEEWLLADQEQRLRDVKQGPDGAIYVGTDEGKILRIAARR